MRHVNEDRVPRFGRASRQAVAQRSLAPPKHLPTGPRQCLHHDMAGQRHFPAAPVGHGHSIRAAGHLTPTPALPGQHGFIVIS